MNKDLYKDFIEECSKEDISDWANKRGFDIKLLKSLKIGKCTAEVMGKLKEKYGINILDENGFINKSNQPKYHERIIIPYSDIYFAARDKEGMQQKFKNLFPKGIKKIPFFIFGNNGADFYVTEGETDAIRLKQEYPYCFVFSLGGAKSKNLFTDMVKKYIETCPKRIIFALDNDDAGKQALKEFTDLIQDSTKREYFKDKLFHLCFDNTKKDIDDYFKLGGKKRKYNL